LLRDNELRGAAPLPSDQRYRARPRQVPGGAHGDAKRGAGRPRHSTVISGEHSCHPVAANTPTGNADHALEPSPSSPSGP
jgi:hypothetical protein